MKTMIGTVAVACALSVAGASGAVPGETELLREFDGIVAKCEAHYTVLLDAMTAQKPDHSPKRFQNGRLVTIPPKDWCSGFFPGSLWYLYELTGKPRWCAAARDYTERLIGPLRHYSGDHDVGFRAYCSAGNALRLTGERRYADFLHDTAAALRTRFDDRIGLIRSWNSKPAKDMWNPRYVVIVDNMMNLELLEWDAKNGGDAKSHRIAVSQADSTDRHHFRPNGSAYHVLSYDPVHPGRITGIYSGQGANVEGTWARGHAWGIYGFTMMYRETHEARYLARAVKAADYWLDEPNLPKDGIAYWDFCAVGEERDASASAIVASALLELQGFVTGEKRAKYRAAAVKMLRSLASETYFNAPGEQGDFLLKHSVGHKPGRSEVDVPLNYADYYFLEGLLRLKRRP